MNIICEGQVCRIRQHLVVKWQIAPSLTCLRHPPLPSMQEDPHCQKSSRTLQKTLFRASVCLIFSILDRFRNMVVQHGRLHGRGPSFLWTLKIYFQVIKAQQALFSGNCTLIKRHFYIPFHFCCSLQIYPPKSYTPHLFKTSPTESTFPVIICGSSRLDLIIWAGLL